MNIERRAWDSDRLLSLELQKRIGVKLFREAVKFVCGHKARIGTENKRQCYECRLKESKQ